MSEWQPIETQPLDGSQVRFRNQVGEYIAPSVKSRELTREQKLELFKHSGEFPNVKWNATHWKPLDETPAREGDAS